MRGLHRAFATGLVLLAAAVLLGTGSVKAFSLGECQEAIASHGFVSPASALPVAIAAVAAELIAGSTALYFLIAGKRPAVGAAAAAIMFLLLSGYAVALTIRPPPRPAPCACGLPGRAAPAAWPRIAATNAGCAVAIRGAAVLLRRQDRGG